jgi:hypothetical protein
MNRIIVCFAGETTTSLGETLGFEYGEYIVGPCHNRIRVAPISNFDRAIVKGAIRKDPEAIRIFTPDNWSEKGILIARERSIDGADVLIYQSEKETPTGNVAHAVEFAKSLGIPTIWLGDLHMQTPDTAADLLEEFIERR